jgi:hypothetical protein
LNDPGTVAALHTLLDNLDTLGGLLEVASSFLVRSPEVMDNVRGTYRLVAGKVREDGAIVRVVPQAAKVGRQSLALTARLADDDAIAKLAASRIMDAGFLDMLFAFLDAARAVQVQVATEPPHRRRSILRLPMMMRDRDFNRGIDFVLRLVTALGQALRPAGSPKSAGDDSGQKGADR